MGGPPSPQDWSAGAWGSAKMGMRWRVVGSIFILVGWLVFILLYAAFWSRGFDLFQNIVIGLVSFVIAGGILGAMWASWGMRFAR